MKKVLFLAMLLALMLPCGQALADAAGAAAAGASWRDGDGIVEVPAPQLYRSSSICTTTGVHQLAAADADRVDANLPDGMVATLTESKGVWTLTIDTEKTDWKRVMQDAYNSDIDKILYTLKIHAPEGATQNRGFGTSENVDSWILEQMQYEFFNHGTAYTNGNLIADYVQSSGMIQPLEFGNEQLMVVQWGDDDGNIICTEKLIYKIAFTSYDPVKEEVPLLPAELIIGDYNMSDAWYEQVKLTVVDGELRYEERRKDDGTTAMVDPQRISIMIRCPYDISKVNQDSGWVFYLGTANDKYPIQYFREVTVDGVTYLAADIQSETIQPGTEMVDVNSWNMQWRNEKDEIVSAGILKITKLFGELRVTASYIDAWKPMDASQIADISIINAVEGLTLTYKDGILRMGVEEGKIPSGANLADVQFSVTVTPPEGAVYYRENHSGGNNIYGGEENMIQHLFETQDRIVQESQRRKISTDPFVLELWPFEEYTSEALGLTVYLNRDLDSEYSGGMTLIYWYDEDDEIISRQWIVEKCDPLERVEKMKAYESEEAIGDGIKMPVVVINADGASEQYILMITMYPQTAQNSTYYELKLVDSRGRLLDVPENCKLYIPYPDGMNHESDMRYWIYHYDGNHQLQEMFIDGASIVKTKYGLCIEVTSMSPFVLNWEEAIVLELPESLTTIDEQAFDGAAFNTVYIPDSCTKIASGAFANVDALYALMPAGTISFAEDSFADDATLIVVEDSDAHVLAKQYGLQFILADEAVQN